LNRANPQKTERKFRCQRLFAALALLAAGLALPGCGGEVQAKLEDYLEELEFDSPLDSVKEIQLGEPYRISVATHNQAFSDNPDKSIWVQVKFKLFVVTEPEHEAAIVAASKRHRGLIDDVVVTTCRKLSLEELDDVRRTALKSNINDALEPLLGKHRIQQFIFNDYVWEPL
jgi:hypothetical protein